MSGPIPRLADLSAEDRRGLKTLLRKFDQSWDEKRLSAAARQLPADSPLRRLGLIELIKIDLEHRRKAGQKVRIESYFKPFPELGTADDVPVDLILAEYEVRRRFGTMGGVGEYATRFPRQAAELRQRIRQADQEALASAPAPRAEPARGEAPRQAGHAPALPPPPPRGGPWWIAPVAALVIVGGVMAAVFVLLNHNPAVVVTNTNTNTNTVAVQLEGLADHLSDPAVLVLIDGKPYTREQLAQPIALPAGDHELVTKRGDAVADTHKFAVGGHGDKQTVQVPPPGGGRGIGRPGADPGDRRPVGAGTVPPPAPEPSSAVKALLDALTDPDSNTVRLQAAASLKKLGDKTAVAPLMDRVADDLFKDDGGSLNLFLSSKTAAVEALKELAPERVTPALVGALAQEKNDEVRLWGCRELGQQDDKESLDALAAASKADKSARVRTEALQAMTQRNK